jgi:hypothetical protein
MPARMHATTRQRGALTFKQRDVQRAIRGVKAMGLAVGKVEVDIKTGKISIATAPTPDTSNGNNPWDEVLTNAPRKKRTA